MNNIQALIWQHGIRKNQIDYFDTDFAEANYLLHIQKGQHLGKAMTNLKSITWDSYNMSFINSIF